MKAESCKIMVPKFAIFNFSKKLEIVNGKCLQNFLVKFLLKIDHFDETVVDPLIQILFIHWKIQNEKTRDWRSVFEFLNLYDDKKNIKNCAVCSY